MSKTDKEIVHDFIKIQRQFSYKQTQRMSNLPIRTIQLASSPTYTPKKQTILKMSYFICKHKKEENKPDAY